jgi:hypothetical protein
MALGIAMPECGAIPGTQYFFTSVGDQSEFAVQDPDELVLMAVPVTLAGPGAWLNDGQIDAEKGQSCIARQPLTGLIAAGGIEGVRISAAGLRGDRRKIYFLHGLHFHI